MCHKKPESATQNDHHHNIYAYIHTYINLTDKSLLGEINVLEVCSFDGLFFYLSFSFRVRDIYIYILVARWSPYANETWKGEAHVTIKISHSDGLQATWGKVEIWFYLQSTKVLLVKLKVHLKHIGYFFPHNLFPTFKAQLNVK